MEILQTIVVGGSVNPPTRAHEAIIAACLALPQFDEVWLMPSGDRLDKSMAASDADRLQMAEIVKQEQFADNPRLKVSDFELRLPRPTKTFRTVQALQRTFRNRNFSFVYGMDSYVDMSNWDHGAALQHSLNLIVFGRNGSPKITAKNVLYQEIGDEFSHVASERARRLVSGAANLAGLVSEPIARYIAERQLYTDGASRRADLQAPQRPAA